MQYHLKLKRVAFIGLLVPPCVFQGPRAHSKLLRLPPNLPPRAYANLNLLQQLEDHQRQD